MKPRIVVLVVIVAGAWLFAFSPLWDTAPGLLIPCLALGVLAVWPAVRWAARPTRGIPVLEAYCFAHVPAYLLPLLNANVQLVQYGNDNRILVAICVCVYLVSLQVGSTLLLLIGKRMQPRIRLFQQDARTLLGPEAILGILGLWCLFSLAVQLRIFPNIGGAYNVAVTIATSCGLVGAYVVCVRIGTGEMQGGLRIVSLLVLALGVVLQVSTGFLVGVAAVFAVCLTAYSLGRGRIPLVACVLCFLLLAFLHLGKGVVRERFWAQDRNYSESAVNPVDVFFFWISASTDALLSSEETEASASIWERGNTARSLAWVMNATPDSLPHLEGLTYYQVPGLLIPRLLWPDKPRGTAPTETLAIYYGFQTFESVEVTSIALGQIAEAWANFGWAGVIGVGLVIGCFFSIPNLITRSRAPLQVGSLLAAVFVAKTFDLESCLGPWLIPLFNALLVGVVVFWFFFGSRLREIPRHALGVPRA